MHLVNLVKFSKSIFEFLFVPVITGFFLKTKGRANAPPLDFVKGGGREANKIKWGNAHPKWRAMKYPGFEGVYVYWLTSCDPVT